MARLPQVRWLWQSADRVKPLRLVLVALIVPLPVLAVVWLVRKLSAMHAESQRYVSDPGWLKDLHRSAAYAEFQGALDEPRTWDRPRRVSEGPVSSYTRAAR